MNVPDWLGTRHGLKKCQGCTGAERSISMRVPCPLAVFLAAVFFLTSKDAHCSRPGLIGQNVTRQADPLYPSQGKPLSENPSSEKEIGKEAVGMQEDAMEIDDLMKDGIGAYEVLKMEREKFEELEESKKVELVKDLTAEGWNELLGKFRVQEKNLTKKTSILQYAIGYSEERLFGMFEEALLKRLEHLFREMCDFGYVSDTPKVIKLLEQGLEEFPSLRRSILFRIYQCKCAATKWHLGKNKEDVEPLKVLVKDGFMNERTIAKHSYEVLSRLAELEIDQSRYGAERVNLCESLEAEAEGKTERALNWLEKGEAYPNDDGGARKADNKFTQLQNLVADQERRINQAFASQATSYASVQPTISLELLKLGESTDSASNQSCISFEDLKRMNSLEFIEFMSKQPTLECKFKSSEGVSAKRKPQSLPSEPISLENLKTAISDASEQGGCLTAYLHIMTSLRQITEKFWNDCLDKLSAYWENQEFFRIAVPAFIEELEALPKFTVVLNCTFDEVLSAVDTFCEERYLQSLLQSLLEMENLTKNCTAFEGLSAEFLTLTANYMRSLIPIRKLYFLLEDPQAFSGSPFKLPDDSIHRPSLLSFVVKLKKLVKDLQEPEFIKTRRLFSSSLEATRKTMVPANRTLISFLTDFLTWEISSLADKASQSISAACERVELAKHAQSIIGDIEKTITLLQENSFDTNLKKAEQWKTIEPYWRNFLESSLEFQNRVADPNLESMKKAVLALSKLVDAFIDAFLKGEDEVWTCGLNIRLAKAEDFWSRALNVLSPVPTKEAPLSWIKYHIGAFGDFRVILHATNLVESLEDPLALDISTREKICAYWREARALMRLSSALSILERFSSLLETMDKHLGSARLRSLLSDILSEDIDFLKRPGINLQQGNYPQFIDELPNDQQEMAKSLKEFSDFVSCHVAEFPIDANIEKVFSTLHSKRYKSLKMSLREVLKNLTQSALQSRPESPQLQSAPSPVNRLKKNQPKSKKTKSKKVLKSRRQSNDSKEPESDRMQACVPSSPQPGNLNDVEIVEESLKLREEDPGAPWSLVEKARNRYIFGSLVRQSAKQVLKRFHAKPRGWEGVLCTDPQDMRSDKSKVKIAVFNVEWLFFFSLATEKLQGKIKWKTLKEAWAHIKDVADTIRKINADILCLCEVQDMRVMSILVGLLPELHYQAYLIPSHDSLGQNVGVLTRVEKPASISRIDDKFFPKNLVLHFKLDNDCGGSVDLVLSGVHLMASTLGADPVKCASIRTRQATVLKSYLTTKYASLKKVIHVALGDFNMVDPELLSANSSCPPEEALDIVKRTKLNLVNVMNRTKVPRDLLESSVCHIFTSQPHLVVDPQIISSSEYETFRGLDRVSDHSIIMATIDLAENGQ